MSDEASTSTTQGSSFSPRPKRKNSGINWLAVSTAIVVIAALVIAITSRSGPRLDWNGNDTRLISQGERAVADLLSDPSSAQFKEVRTDKQCLLGKVNAKNRMGGYVGYRSFYFDGRINQGGIAGGDDPSGVDDLDLKRIEENDAYMTGESDCLSGGQFSQDVSNAANQSRS